MHSAKKRQNGTRLGCHVNYEEAKVDVTKTKPPAHMNVSYASPAELFCNYPRNIFVPGEAGAR